MLVRHARSPQGSPDHGRPLDEQGRRDATALGRRIAELGWPPDRVLCSDARRAVETWKHVAPALPEVPVEVTRDLYLAGAEAFDEVVRQQDEAVTCLLAVGHNPGWEEVAHLLTGVDVKLAPASAVLLRRRTVEPWRAGLGVRTWDPVAVLRADAD